MPEELPVTLRWIESDSTEHTERYLSEGELTLRVIRLLIRYFNGEVLRIVVEHDELGDLCREVKQHVQ